MEECSVLIETTKSAENKPLAGLIYPLIMSCSVTCSAWKLTAMIIKSLI